MASRAALEAFFPAAMAFSIATCISSKSAEQAPTYCSTKEAAPRTCPGWSAAASRYFSAAWRMRTMALSTSTNCWPSLIHFNVASASTGARRSALRPPARPPGEATRRRRRRATEPSWDEMTACVARMRLSERRFTSSTPPWGAAAAAGSARSSRAAVEFTSAWSTRASRRNSCKTPRLSFLPLLSLSRPWLYSDLRCCLFLAATTLPFSSCSSESVDAPAPGDEDTSCSDDSRGDKSASPDSSARDAAPAAASSAAAARASKLSCICVKPSSKLCSVLCCS
mmetsp:Transcript_57066/g.102559  ORF Transcript_57066/g.102559 Transcript_57066/m.102559 type:complete len:282 (+) Transcript_57066:934-1779(+)